MILAHVTIHTTKLEESVEFYKKTAGLEIMRDMRDRDVNKIVFVGDKDCSVLVELIESGEAFSGSGISIGFSVNGIKALYEKMEKEGYEPYGMKSTGPQTSFFMIKDPNGFPVQFIGEN